VVPPTSASGLAPRDVSRALGGTRRRGLVDRVERARAGFEDLEWKFHWADPPEPSSLRERPSESTPSFRSGGLGKSRPPEYSKGMSAQGEEPRLLKTSEILKRTGITHQVLYRYVTVGLIEPALETETGQRFFKPSVVPLIRLIQSCNQSGYTLRDLKDTFFQDKNIRKLKSR
jgi:hypothetical protein